MLREALRNLNTPMHDKSYVIWYAYWIIEALMKQPTNMNLVMDLALIINAFFETGFVAYTADDVNGQPCVDSTPRYNDLCLNKLQRSTPVQPTKLLPTNNILNELQNYSKLERLGKWKKQQINAENLLETKKMLEKEHLLRQNNIDHYWDIISIVFGEIDTCRFVSFNPCDLRSQTGTESSSAQNNDNGDESQCCSQKAIGWILLTLRQGNMLNHILKTMYEISFVQEFWYDHSQSYFITFKENIIEIAKLLETIPLNFQMKITSDYDFYISEVKNNETQLNSKISKQVTYEVGFDEYENPVVFDEQVQIEDLQTLEQIPKLNI